MKAKVLFEEHGQKSRWKDFTLFTARKNYRCNVCLKSISIGEHYWVSSDIMEKIHEACTIKVQPFTVKGAL